MSLEKIADVPTSPESVLTEFDTRRVTGGVWLRVVLAGVGASGVISPDEARALAASLKFTAALPVPPQPKAGAR